jgi:hypothetical protein
MAIDHSTLVYLPAYDAFARPVTFTGSAQPSGARGIYDTVPIDVAAEDGSIFSDQRTVLDIREAEFTVLPKQGDTVDIPAVGSIVAAGSFMVVESDSNGGGEMTLTLRRLVTAKP